MLGSFLFSMLLINWAAFRFGGFIGLDANWMRWHHNGWIYGDDQPLNDLGYFNSPFEVYAMSIHRWKVAAYLKVIPWLILLLEDIYWFVSNNARWLVMLTWITIAASASINQENPLDRIHPFRGLTVIYSWIALACAVIAYSISRSNGERSILSDDFEKFAIAAISYVLSCLI
jgi:hypothetical protein